MNRIAVANDRHLFLRRVLGVDAATCAVTGALMMLGAAPLAGWLGLPSVLLFWAGASLFPIAVFMLWVATRRVPALSAVWLVIAGNAAWVAGSALVLVLCEATRLGWVFVIAQAVAVALLAELEYMGLRRAEGARLASTGGSFA